VKAEGWYQDPYGVHKDRWYSDGNPTALVRDAGVESSDPPPADGPVDDQLVRSVPDKPSPGPVDLRREGEAPDYQGKAFEVIAEFIPPY
jgi:hypothetical protein